MKANLQSLLAILLVLSAAVKQARAEDFNMDEVGVIAVVMKENPSECTATAGLHTWLQNKFQTIVSKIIRDAQREAGAGGGRQLSSDELSRSRRLCFQGCSGSQCYVACPQYSCRCRRRELEEIQQEIEANLRGGDGNARELQTPPILANGFVEGYEHDHPEAAAYCELVLGKVKSDLDLLAWIAGKFLGCQDLFTDPMVIGCVNVA